MASNSTKSFLADAGYGEQELDANSALMELDKGTGRRGAGEAPGESGAILWQQPELERRMRRGVVREAPLQALPGLLALHSCPRGPR